MNCGIRDTKRTKNQDEHNVVHSYVSWCSLCPVHLPEQVPPEEALRRKYEAYEAFFETIEKYYPRKKSLYLNIPVDEKRSSE